MVLNNFYDLQLMNEEDGGLWDQPGQGCFQERLTARIQRMQPKLNKKILQISIANNC